MTRELFVAAALLILPPSALAEPAGAGAGPAAAATRSTPPATGTPAPGVAGSTDTSVSGQISSTLEAGQISPSGQIPGVDSGTVGGASAGQGLRTPNPSTGTYGGLANRAYVPPGATPYTGPTTGRSGAVQGR